MDSKQLTIDHSRQEPLVQQIHNQLREQIERGELEHSTRLPSMRKLSEATGVSLGIVRQAIGQLTQTGHLRVDARRGVFVSSPKLKVMDIALVLPTLRSHFVPQLMEGVLGGLAGTQYRMVVESAHGNFRDEMLLLERLDRAFLSGVIISPPPFKKDAEVISRLMGRGLPCVQVLASTDDDASPSVLSDEFEMGRRAIAILAEKGHRRIAIMDTNADAASIQTFRCGLDAGLSSIGLSLDTIPVVRGDASQIDPLHPFEASEESARYLLRKYPESTAVIGVTPNRAIGMCRAAIEAGMSIPDDLSIIGTSGDSDVAALTGPGITTLTRPVKAIGQRAALMLRQMIQNKNASPKNSIHLEPILNPRGSVAAPRV